MKRIPFKGQILITLLVISALLILIGDYILPISQVEKGIFIHPLSEELLKLPFLFLFIDYLVTSRIISDRL